MIKTEKIFLWAVQGLVYISLFTPLIVRRDFFFPYVSPKTFFFRSIVDLMLIAYVFLIMSNRKYLPKINILTVTLAAFLLIVILTSVLGVNFSRSFWSTYERMGGVLTFIHLFVFFLILSSVFKERKYWERFMVAAIAVGIILVIYVYGSQDSTARGGGTIGNTSFLSAYLIFDIFFAIILFLTKPGWQKIIFGPLAIPLIWLLLFSPQESTKGAIGAFFGGLALLAISSGFYLIYFSQKRLLKKIAPLFLAVIILAVAGISQTGFVKNGIKSFQESSSWQARAIVWKMGYSAWQEKPLFGWGQDNFNIPFGKYFEPSLPISGDIWYDRVHNIVFDNLVASGIFGLLSYLAIFGVAAICLFKTAAKVTEKKNIFLPLGLTSLLAVYFAQDFWVFDMISSYFMFFFTLAFISFLIEAKKPPEFKSDIQKRGRFLPLFSGILIVISVLTLYFGNIQPARASTFIIKALTNPLDKGLSYFQKAIDASPMALTETAEQFSRAISDFFVNGGPEKDVLAKGFKQAIDDLEKSRKMSPQDFRVYLLLGKLYGDFFLFSQNEEYLIKAEEILNQAAGLSPKNQQTYWSLAQIRLSRGDNQAAIDLMEKAVEFEPKFGQSQWYLAMTYKISGKDQLALDAVKKAAEGGFDWSASTEYLQKVAELYQNIGDDQSLVTLYTLAVNKAPKNPKFKIGLAIAYANLGQFDKARQFANEALDLKPDFTDQIIEFLNSLPK